MLTIDHAHCTEMTRSVSVSIPLLPSWFHHVLGNILSPDGSAQLVTRVVLANPLIACTDLQHPDIVNATTQQIRDYYQGAVTSAKHSHRNDGRLTLQPTLLAADATPRTARNATPQHTKQRQAYTSLRNHYKRRWHQVSSFLVMLMHASLLYVVYVCVLCASTDVCFCVCDVAL